jgi:hypothetical protein
LVLSAAVALAALPAPAKGQGLVEMAKEAAKKTSVGKQVRKLGAEAQLLDATTVNLEASNLSTVQVGSLKLGVSSVDIKNGDAVRLRLYLFNPAQQDAAVPVPPADLFTLVDEKGRKLELMGELSVKNMVAGSTEITVPAMERIEMTLLYESLAADAKLGNLKVGSTGTITGIPLNTGAPVTPAAAANSPWKK